VELAAGTQRAAISIAEIQTTFEPLKHGEQALPGDADLRDDASANGDRPLPFAAEVAIEWISDDESGPAPGNDPGLVFRPRAPLTGNVLVTAGGQDVQFSDIGLTG
jgi:hypothetical protein